VQFHEVDDLLAVSDEVAWLHPAASSGKPSEVELLPPSSLAGRLTNTGSRAAG